MIYWLIIILGIFLLATSISNPLYSVILKKYINNNNIFFETLIRLVLFFLSVIVIFLGIYFESIL